MFYRWAMASIAMWHSPTSLKFDDRVPHWIFRFGQCCYSSWLDFPNNNKCYVSQRDLPKHWWCSYQACDVMMFLWKLHFTNKMLERSLWRISMTSPIKTGDSKIHMMIFPPGLTPAISRSCLRESMMFIRKNTWDINGMTRPHISPHSWGLEPWKNPIYRWPVKKWRFSWNRGTQMDGF